jgi:ribosomal protein S9
VLSLDRALFLAKEAGIYTTRELQTHVIKSPSFSQSDAPFLLEDFFVSVADKDMETLPARKAKKEVTVSVEKEETEKKTSEVVAECETVRNFLLRASQGEIPARFEHNGREFLEKSTGQGTKKRARAQVMLMRGTGVVRVNGFEDFWKRWPLYYNRFDVLKPFKVTKTAGIYDVFISVKGGGISGQAAAARLATARALVAACGATAGELSECLYEDTRQKTSKMAGRNGAFARDKNKQ